MANPIQENLYRIAFAGERNYVYVTAKAKDELIRFLFDNYADHTINSAEQLMPDGSLTPVPIAADPLFRQLKEDKERTTAELAKIDTLCSKPLLERTGAEQEYLYNYWVNHPKYNHGSTSYMLGMTPAEFRAWRNGDLKLANGAYHELEPAQYHLSDAALRAARKLLTDPQFIGAAQHTSVQHPQHLITELKDQLSLKDRFNTTLYNRNDILVLLYGVEPLAAITQDEVLYKEDFAPLMKAAGMDATERNFYKVWRNFTSVPGFTLQGCAKIAISKTQSELETSSLEDKIHAAKARTSKPVSNKNEIDLEPVR